jgi:UDP-glucose 4-epimerase
MKILITGGAGFIASNVADAYIAAGHEVAVVDDLSSGKRENVNPRAKFYQLDIGDPKLAQVFAEFKPQLVNQHAAQISVPISVDDPLGDARTNVLGLLNVLTNCREHKVAKVIYVSSGGVVYGEPDHFPADETFPLQPASPYGIAKYAGELYLKFFAANCGLKYVALRYSNVYGPRQVPHGEAGVVSIFIQALLAQQAPTIFGDGKYVRDYVFVGDVVQANLLAVERGENVAVNIGTGKPSDTNEIYRLVREAMHSSFQAQSGPARRGDLRANYLDASLAGRVLGWKPQVSLPEGIAKTVQYFQDLAKQGRK